MLAILETWAEDGRCLQVNTAHYLFLLLFKVALNAMILASCIRCMRGSFMCVSGLSLCLADVLLLFAVARSWLADEDAKASAPMCFLLSHASTIYAQLPLPLLLLGALDHALHSSLGTRCWSCARLPVCCALVLLTWVLAVLHSYWHTNSTVVELHDDATRLALLCIVHGSSFIMWFCTMLSVAVLSILLLSYPGIWLQLRASSHQPLIEPEAPKQLFENHVEAEVPPGQTGQPRQLLFFRLALAFALNWSPFLLINVVCALLDFAVPSYISVNLLWLLCANSLMVAAAVCFSGGQLAKDVELVDDTCVWSLTWCTWTGVDWQSMFHRNIYTVSGKGTADLLLI